MFFFLRQGILVPQTHQPKDHLLSAVGTFYSYMKPASFIHLLFHIEKYKINNFQ
jgi:hypothetical protein